MLTLSSIGVAITWLTSHLWVFLLALVPSAQKFLQPAWEAVLGALNAILGAVWGGLKTATFNTWVLIALTALVGFWAGYHDGWNACLDWVHAHFRLVTKVPVSNWFSWVW